MKIPHRYIRYIFKKLHIERVGDAYVCFGAVVPKKADICRNRYRLTDKIEI